MKKRIVSILLSALTVFPVCAMDAYAAETNGAPTVIPAIREWTGGNGKFELTDTVVIDSSAVSVSDAKKEIITEAFDSYLGVNTVFSSDNPQIVFKPEAQSEKLGEDGYIMEISESKIEISAPNEIGFLYGIYTVLQSVKADGYVPCGRAEDYSYYKIRGGMIDVARAYIPLEYVEEITKYYAFFKLNEIHLHINDVGENGYYIFRLESDVPGLTATDGYYSKDDYRAYQKRMLEYGVEVITEIDTPAHSSCFASVIPELMLDNRHIDISKPEAVQFVLDLFDEYITGEDPVFVSKKVHIGTDEYPAGYNELMRAYTDTLIKHMNARGYTPRFWGSFGGEGFNGNTPVSSEAQANYWAVSLSDYRTLLSMGYDIINTCGPSLYIVPGGNYGFVDYYDLKQLYSTWHVNVLGPGTIKADHEQLLGANFALWNDLHTEYSGFSIFDIFDRLRGAVCLISEKTWCGTQATKDKADGFAERTEKLSWYAPNSDPGRHNVPEIDGNTEGIKSFGWPYVASADITVNSLGSGDTPLFSGKDGTLYVSSKGKIGFKREVYNFTYDCNIELGKKTNIKLYATNKQTILCIDDTYYYHPNNTKNLNLTKSSTFIFPLEEIGKELDGKIENVKITAGEVDLSEHLATGNYALNRPATVSGLEVNDGRFTQAMALDGNTATRLSFSANQDEQWLLVDLESVKTVNKVVIKFFEHISDYSVLVSEDGVEFTEVARVQKGKDQAKQTDTVTFDSVKARYIKYVQHKRFYVSDWNAYYSGGITEFEVYGFDVSEYNQKVTKAYDLIYEEKADVTALKAAAKALSSYLKEDNVYITHLFALSNKVDAEIEAYEYARDNPSPEVSEDSSHVASEPENSTVSAPDEGKKDNVNPFVWVAIAIGALSAAGVAIGLYLKSKRKEKN